jgi:hypothetical protein
LGLSRSERSRLLFFANEMWSISTKLEQQFVCFADRDFADILPDPPLAYNYLILTEYSSIELHAFSSTAIEKLLSVAFARNVEGDKVLDAFEPVLMQLYLMRASSLALEWGLSWIHTRRYLSKDANGAVLLDVDGYVVAYLLGGGRGGERWRFDGEMQRLAAMIAGHDRRRCVRGHDFMELFGWYFKDLLGSVGLTAGKSSEALGRFLFAALDLAEWHASSDFQRVLTRLAL